jgi:transposase
MDRRFVEKLAVKPLEFYVNRYEYPKYVTVNEIEGGVIQARAIEAPIEKSKVDPTLLVLIATMKGCFHLPLYRIQEFFRQYGIEMSRQPLGNYYLQTAQVLEPLAEAIKW